jgi:hypothetical protein
LRRSREAELAAKIPVAERAGDTGEKLKVFRGVPVLRNDEDKKPDVVLPSGAPKSIACRVREKRVSG